MTSHHTTAFNECSLHQTHSDEDIITLTNEVNNKSKNLLFNINTLIDKIKSLECSVSEIKTSINTNMIQYC